MKRKFLLLPLLLLCLNAHALILSVEGYGEVPTDGLDITIDKAEIDFFTGEPVMKCEGSLQTYPVAPVGLLYYNDTLYVCDNFSHRVFLVKP